MKLLKTLTTLVILPASYAQNAPLSLTSSEDAPLSVTSAAAPVTTTVVSLVFRTITGRQMTMSVDPTVPFSLIRESIFNMAQAEGMHGSTTPNIDNMRLIINGSSVTPTQSLNDAAGGDISTVGSRILSFHNF